MNNHHLIKEGQQEAAIGGFLLAHEGHTQEVEVQRGTWSVYCYCAACGDLHTYEVDNEARERAIGLAERQEEYKKPPVQLLQTAQAQHQQPKTIAILGSDTVGRTLCVLLEGSGYDTILLDGSPPGVVDELLKGAHLLLITPRVDEGSREASLGAMSKNTPQVRDMPVMALCTAPEEDLPAKEGVISVPWPCETKILMQRIEAALLDAPAASRASTRDFPLPY